jgi:DNA-binding GntR family transcriptional regulator
MLPNPPLVFSLREQIADQLRCDVLCGRLPEGERLSELKLVERFGVSRTPVREALQQLIHEGLLEGRPNVGVTVANRPPDAIRELVIPIRRSVEVFALHSFFDSLSEVDFQRWKQILEKMKEACVAADYAAIAEHDVSFHRSIVRRAHQRDLESIWNSLLSRVRSHFWETQQRDYDEPLEIYEEHDAIIETFRSRDLDASVKALEDNIR